MIGKRYIRLHRDVGGCGVIWCESIEKLGRRGLSVFCPLSLQNLYIGVFKDLGDSERSERMYGCDGILIYRFPITPYSNYIGSIR